MRPDALAQFGGPVLAVTPGLTGFRIVIAGGRHYDVLASFPTPDAAYAAYQEAIRLSNSIKEPHP